MSALSSVKVAPACSEHDLVAAVRLGDDRAFGELYERFGRRIVSYVFGMVGDHGRAEDITQEVFISALRRMRETERPIAFKPWIYEIARNACIDEFRRTKRTREVPLATEDDPEDSDRRLVSRANSPDATLEQRQQLDDLRGAFRGLSENHHKLIVMRELEGLSYDEIGKRMGMSRPVVESTLFRARRRLNDEYQEIASGRRCEQVHAVVELGAKAIQSLGIKERRRVARHVSHCQPCRRFARAKGLDDSVLQTPGLVGKIAALLPIPAFLRWRRGGGSGGDGDAANSVGSHSFSALQSVQTVAQYINPASPAVGLGRAAAAVAAVVVAGGGVVGGLSAANSGSKSHSVKPAAHVAPASTGSGKANEPRAAATKPRTTSGAAGFTIAKAHQSGAGSSGASTRAATSSGSGSSTAGSTGSSGGGGATGTTASTHGGNSGGGSSNGGTLQNLGLPSTPSLPPIRVPKLPPINLPQVNLPGTVQNTLDGAGRTVGNLVNPLKGIL